MLPPMISLGEVSEVWLTCWFAKHLDNEKFGYHTNNIFQTIFITVIKKFHSMDKY